MLPIIDFGGIALVIPKITAIGHVIDGENSFEIEVFMNGMDKPFIISFATTDEAEEAREELIAMVAQYYYISEFGPDFDIEEYAENFGNDDEDKH